MSEGREGDSDSDSDLEGIYFLVVEALRVGKPCTGKGRFKFQRDRIPVRICIPKRGVGCCSPDGQTSGAGGVVDI